MWTSSWRPDNWLFGASAIDLGRLYTYNATTNTFTFDAPCYSPEICEEDIPEMNIEEYRDEKSFNHRYAVACHNYTDLSQERILKSISVMKSKLMMQCLPYRVDRIECKMSPMVKTNMINAYRRVNMYGKKTPFVACFDEYGRRLPDEVKIDTIRGMDIKIVDPATYGNNYLVFEAVVPGKEYVKTTSNDDLDLPF